MSDPPILFCPQCNHVCKSLRGLAQHITHRPACWQKYLPILDGITTQKPTLALVRTDPLAKLKANFKGQLDNRKKTNADFQSQLDSETAAHEMEDPLANLKADCESIKADCYSQLGSQKANVKSQITARLQRL
jgi:hypothetical protein